MIKNPRKVGFKLKIASEIRGKKSREETNVGKFIQGWDGGEETWKLSRSVLELLLRKMGSEIDPSRSQSVY